MVDPYLLADYNEVPLPYAVKACKYNYLILTEPACASPIAIFFPLL